MTLAEWAQGWPHTVQQHPNGGMWTPDTYDNGHYRFLAWQLLDYRVSSVTGGSIWFTPRPVGLFLAALGRV